MPIRCQSDAEPNLTPSSPLLPLHLSSSSPLLPLHLSSSFHALLGNAAGRHRRRNPSARLATRARRHSRLQRCRQRARHARSRLRDVCTRRVRPDVTPRPFARLAPSCLFGPVHRQDALALQSCDRKAAGRTELLSLFLRPSRTNLPCKKHSPGTARRRGTRGQKPLPTFHRRRKPRARTLPLSVARRNRKRKNLLCNRPRLA